MMYNLFFHSYLFLKSPQRTWWFSTWWVSRVLYWCESISSISTCILFTMLGNLLSSCCCWRSSCTTESTTHSWASSHSHTLILLCWRICAPWWCWCWLLVFLREPIISTSTIVMSETETTGATWLMMNFHWGETFTMSTLIHYCKFIFKLYSNQLKKTVKYFI